MSSGDSAGPPHGHRLQFATTQWSVVLAAGDAARPEARAALAELCEAYWYPLYAYVRRRVPSTHEAHDLTQSFFAHLLEKETLAKAERERGQFRAFLLTAFKHFLANEWNKERAAKRGGGQGTLALDFTQGDSRYQIEPAHDLTPEKLYERRWATTLLDQVLERLRVELESTGKADHFEHLKTSLAGQSCDEGYEAAATALGISPAAAKQAAYRMRKRYRELLRAEVARTVDGEAEVDEEIGRLFESLG